MDPILDDLNPEQRQAVEHDRGPLMVLAGAGSGKTRVITRRIAHLMRRGVLPGEILALTFTNKAAAEMARRAEQLGGGRVLVATFHSAAARFLRRDGHLLGYPRDFSIYDTYDRDSCIKMLMAEHGIDKGSVKPAQVGRRLSRLKNAGARVDDFEHMLGFSAADEALQRLFRPYHETMRRLGAMDFDDLLGRFLDLLTEFPEQAEEYQARFPWLLVDEFQDTNRIQYDLIRKLTGNKERNLCVVGDPDQSIYRFRGADIRNILDFEQDFSDTRIIRLEQNYRSTRCILRAAEAVIANNVHRKQKSLHTENEEGDAIQLSCAPDPGSEARGIAQQIDLLIEGGTAAEEVAVFYRSHFLSRSIEEGLRQFGVPYRVVGGVSFFERREIKDLLAYQRVLVNPIDDLSMERVVNVPPRGVGRATLDKLRAIAREAGMSLFEAIMDPDCRAGLAKKPRENLAALARAFEEARAVASESAHRAMLRIAEGIGYLDYIGDMGDPEDSARRENVEELVNDAATFDEERGEGLSGYLQHVSLLSSEDRSREGPRVSLMTVHAAKGLEFDNVFVAGMEEDVFPNGMNVVEGELEEERRLMYVALTRARKRLWLSHCRTRMIRGSFESQVPSSFLEEIPPDCLHEAEGEVSPERADEVWDSWDAEPALEPDYSQEQVELEAGVRVLHPVYGEGEVLRLRGEGQRAQVTVRFQRSGERTLVLEYAGLQIVPGTSGGGYP